MKNKICIITGANAGIGKQAAIQIAQKGYHVIIGCRNKERGESAKKEIKEKSHSEDVTFLLVDMSLKKSIEEFSYKVHEIFDQVDVLIHNAAVFDMSQKKSILTKEGYESIWMTNHIGPVYLTNQLLDLLQKSDDARILTVSSKGLLAMPMLKVDLKDPEFKNRKFTVTKAYYQAKRAQVMYTYWLAEQLKELGISVNSIRVTAVKVDKSRYENISAVQKLAYRVKSLKCIEPKQMAKTYTYLATSPEVKGITGKYYDENNKQVTSNSYTTKMQNIEAVMDLTKQYL